MYPDRWTTQMKLRKNSIFPVSINTEQCCFSKTTPPWGRKTISPDPIEKKMKTKAQTCWKERERNFLTGGCQDCALILSFDIGGLRDLYQGPTESQIHQTPQLLARISLDGLLQTDGYFHTFPSAFQHLGLTERSAVWMSGVLGKVPSLSRPPQGKRISR